MIYLLINHFDSSDDSDRTFLFYHWYACQI